MKKKGLGRGVDAILADNDFIVDEPKSDEGIQTLRISDIEPNRDQPRKAFDEEAYIPHPGIHHPHQVPDGTWSEAFF